MESCSTKRQWEEVYTRDFIARTDSILHISKRSRPQKFFTCETEHNTDFSVFTKNGIDYDRPLTPMEVAQKRIERLSREKQRVQSPTFEFQPCPKLPTDHFSGDGSKFPTTDHFNGNGNNCVLEKIMPSLYETPGQNKIAWCICVSNGRKVTGCQGSYATESNIVSLSIRGEFRDGDILQSAPKCKTCETGGPKRISCCVCFDDEHKISTTKRNLMSTFCGHVFCDTCINQVIKKHPLCPVCRKKITKKNVHKIFI